MARRRQIPKYGTVEHNGVTYYRTRIRDADGKRVALAAEVHFLFSRGQPFNKGESNEENPFQGRYS